jgi:N-acyl-D-amino-acid deacylase
MHDILISGGTVIDGTGAPPARLDVAVDGLKIVGLYKESEAKASVKIDAKGKVVCPGFIDIHSHSDISLLGCPLADSRIMQGITTELVGNCGGSAAPLVGAASESLASQAKEWCVNLNWVTMDEYLLRLADMKTSVNVCTLVGAETLRWGVVGVEDKRPTDEQMDHMRKLLADSMVQGAFGVSSGLIYAPGCFATTEELISLASTAGALGGMYASHIRGESRTVVDAVAEAIRIGREGECRVEISHHKACGRLNWGLVNTTLKLIDQARADGVDVAFDVYPYMASGTSLDAILPPWARDGGKPAILKRLADPGTRNKIKETFKDRFTPWENTVPEDGWENIYVSGFKKAENRRFDNKPVTEIAKELGKSPDEAALDLMVEEDLGIGAVFHEMSEDDVMTVMKHPLASIGSDGNSESTYGPTAQSATHPRSYGTFPRVIRRYALDKKLFPLEEAVRKMTSWPAERIGLKDRGVLAKGMAGDIVVFDPGTIADTSTYEKSHSYPVGIEHVLVNGSVTVENGRHTREKAGLVLKKQVKIA